MFKLKITFICENTAQSRGILGEHGLAVLLETGNKRFLLDTGAGLTLLHNAQKLGVDLKHLDGVLISHGHYDHTGGLKALLDHAGPLTVYAHPDIFTLKYRFREGEPTYIGIPWSKEELENYGATFHLERKPVSPVKGIILSGEIPRNEHFEEPEKNFYVRNGDNYTTDALLDDQSVAVEIPQGLVIVSGCAHSGLINTLRHLVRTTDRQVYAVFGGTHLFAAKQEQIHATVQALKELGVQIIGTCHCTGLPAKIAFAKAFGKNFIPCHAGTTFTIE